LLQLVLFGKRKKMKKSLLLSVTVCLCSMPPKSAFADIIWDFGPSTGSLNGAFFDVSDAQNFAENVVFAQGALLTGFDLYSAHTPNTNYRFRLWSDASGSPGLLLDDVSAPPVQSEVIQANATPSNDLDKITFRLPVSMVLAPNTTYWVGLSGDGGDNLDPGWWHFQGPGDHVFAQFNGLQLVASGQRNEDMMFQLEGSLPEPTIISSLVVVGTMELLRRRKH
jgi:hypothetical protein